MPVAVEFGIHIAGQIVFALLATYLIATIAECYLHRVVGHASVKTRRFWAKHPSALSQLDFRVDRGEFAAGVVDLHLPVDAALDA